ncbi:MAG: error-prone DNA polymerase [Spirochaetales bacterium]
MGRIPSKSVPLWCSSTYSFLEGASDPAELVSHAGALGYSAVGITDRNGLYGAVQAFAAWRDALSNGAAAAAGKPGAGNHQPQIRHGAAPRNNVDEQLVSSCARPLVGACVTLAPEETTGSVLVFARDREGYGNLCEVLSAGLLRNAKGSCFVYPEELAERCAGLVLVFVPDPDYPGSVAVEPLREAFAGRVYCGIARHSRAEDRVLEQSGRALSERWDIPRVATPHVLYHEKDRRALQDVLTCIRHGCTLEEAGSRLLPNAEFALKSPHAIDRLYEDDPELLRNTLEIAESCDFHLGLLHYRYPDERLGEGYTSSGRLHELTWSGARTRYPKGIPGDVGAQLERELSVIDDLDYCGYFLTMYEIVSFCRQEGILCQGRGSAANSAVCYCLGITAVDPIRMKLLFERFISRERAEPPDIDLDIEHDRREEVIEFMYRRYGRRHAAMVANVVRYRPRSAVREVGKVLGFPETTVDRIARLTPHRDSTLGHAVEQAGLDPDRGSAAFLVRLCEQIVGVPRHLSIHPGGFLLGGEPVTRIVPVENATMPGRTVIQWDKDDIETLDLFKVDLLGLGALSHLDYCFRLIEKHRGVRLGMADIPPDDPGVYRMISRGDTIGIFQLESRAQMAMLPRLRPERYYDIVIEISIVRPGPITGGMVHPYLRRRHGEEPVEYPHPSLKPVLEKTLGVPLFQEQVMKLAVIAADYTPGEADQLRRDMAAWRKTGRMEKHREALIERMSAKGIAPQFAERVFDQIRGFGEYGFPESHAASFALIAYATAWMRYHYPAEFYCGLLNAWPMGFYAPSTIVEDARRHGVEVRSADIYASEWFCTLEAGAAGRSLGGAAAGRARRTASRAGSLPQHAGRGEIFALRMGLRFVRGLGESDYDRIAAERSRAFSSLEDFRSRTGIHENVAVALAESGALRPLAVTRRSALWKSYGHRRRATGEAERVDRMSNRPNHSDLGKRREDGSAPSEQEHSPYEQQFDRDEHQFILDKPQFIQGGFDFREPTPSLPHLSAWERVCWDYQSSGYSSAGHPLEHLREEFAREGLPDSAALARRADGASVRYAGLVICRQRPDTAGGTLFMTLEDEGGFVNIIVRESLVRKYRALVLTKSLVGVTGVLQAHPTSPYILAEQLWEPSVSRRPASPASHDFH